MSGLAYRARKALRVSQRRFADLLDVHPGTVARWESGDRLPTGPTRTLLRMIEAEPKVVLVLLAVRPQKPSIT